MNVCLFRIKLNTGSKVARHINQSFLKGKQIGIYNLSLSTANYSKLSKYKNNSSNFIISDYLKNYQYNSDQSNYEKKLRWHKEILAFKFGFCVVGFLAWKFFGPNKNYYNSLITPMVSMYKLDAASAITPSTDTESSAEYTNASPNCQIVTPKNKKRNPLNVVADAYEKVADSVISIYISDGCKTANGVEKHSKGGLKHGSGFVISSDGYALTNFHLVKNACDQTISVQTKNGSYYAAKVVKFDRSCDLALLKLEGDGFKPIPLSNSHEVRPGEFVFLVGSPLGLQDSIAAGVVSSKARNFYKDPMIQTPFSIPFVQTDIVAMGGNSGGPLLNLNGEAIGIITSSIANRYSLAVPVDFAHQLIDRFNKNLEFQKNTPTYAYLGVSILSLKSPLKVQHGNSCSEHKGVIVASVAKDSPAQQAGLQENDVIIAMNDATITSPKRFYFKLKESMQQRKDITVKVLRNGQLHEFKVQPEE